MHYYSHRIIMVDASSQIVVDITGGGGGGTALSPLRAHAVEARFPCWFELTSVSPTPCRSCPLRCHRRAELPAIFTSLDSSRLVIRHAIFLRHITFDWQLKSRLLFHLPR